MNDSDSRASLLEAIRAAKNATHTVAAVATPPLTVNALEKMLQAVQKLPPEPIGVWMRQRGHDPEDWLLILPEKFRDEIGPFEPSYVRFAPITVPLFMQRQQGG